MTPEREAQIRSSTDAVFVATDSLFANPAYKEDLDLARSLQKPILDMHGNVPCEIMNGMLPEQDVPRETQPGPGPHVQS